MDFWCRGGCCGGGGDDDGDDGGGRLVVVCSIDGPLEARGCYAMVFDGIHGNKKLVTDGPTDGRTHPLIESRTCD